MLRPTYALTKDDNKSDTVNNEMRNDKSCQHFKATSIAQIPPDIRYMFHNSGVYQT